MGKDHGLGTVAEADFHEDAGDVPVSLGTADPPKAPSGYALQLSLGPLDSLVDMLRLARAHKYSLLLKMVQRVHQAGQAPDWPAAECFPARMVFGPRTPTDRTAILDEVVKGVTAGVFSLETGIRMLQDAGYPIEDARGGPASSQPPDLLPRK